MKRVTVPIIAAVLALSGCGGNDSPEPRTVTVQAAPTETAPVQPPTPTKAQDRATAEAGRLELADMPTGWATAEVPKGRSKCPSVAAARNAVSARAGSVRFSDDAAAVDHAVYGYADEDAASKALTGLTDDGARKCQAKESAAAGAAAGTRVTDSTIAEVNAAPLGDDTVGFRMTFETVNDGIEGQVVMDQVTTRVGRFLSIVSFLNADEDLLRSVPETAARKVKRAVAEG